MNTNLMLLLGAAFSVSGALLLRSAWRSRRAGLTARRRLHVIAAWTLIAAAFVPWAIATGADKGAAFAILLFMLAGVALVLRAGFTHEGNGRRAAERETRVNGTAAGGARLLLRRIGVFLLAGPVSGAAAIFLAAALFAAWTGSAANRLAAVMLFVPFAWALLAMFATYDVRLRYRSLAVCAFLFAGLAGTFLPEFP